MSIQRLESSGVNLPRRTISVEAGHGVSKRTERAKEMLDVCLDRGPAVAPGAVPVGGIRRRERLRREFLFVERPAFHGLPRQLVEFDRVLPPAELHVAAISVAAERRGGHGSGVMD